MAKYTGEQSKEMRTFEKLLSAIYLEPYQIYSIAQLENLTEMADYYCALRVVSCTLHAALFEQSWLGDALRKEPCRALIAATALRNKTHFKERLMLCVGPWNKPVHNDWNWDDADLYALVINTRNKIAAELDNVHRLFLNEATPKPDANAERAEQRKKLAQELTSEIITKNATGKSGQIQLLSYYRLLFVSKAVECFPSALQGIENLLANDLRLDTRAKAGKGAFVDFSGTTSTTMMIFLGIRRRKNGEGK
jgi:hypothetical protein